jgi:hypothetical protein
MYNRKNPATVGGNTSGRVRMPSRIIFQRFRRISATIFAAKIPKKNVSTIAADAVFMEISRGDVSIYRGPLKPYF